MVLQDMNDVRNAISMALHDVILQQAFELMCKQLDEQEKKIKQLENDYEELLSHKRFCYA